MAAFAAENAGDTAAAIRYLEVAAKDRRSR